MEQPLQLAGKVALVTGASSGLGKRFAAVLAAAGASVAACARRLDHLETLCGQIASEGGKAVAIQMDVTDVASVGNGFAAVEARLGPVDIVVNNSGTQVQKRLGAYDEADYDKLMDTNAKGAFFVAQTAGRSMIASGRKGRIINISSTLAFRPVSQLSVYAMSKAALNQLTRSMAQEWARYGICTNAICPGYIETEINSHYWKTEGGQKLQNMLPRRRVGQAQDLDGLLLLLASDQSHFINGALIAADDGFSAG